MEMSFITINLKKKEEDSKMLNKAIKNMSVAEIESFLEQRRIEEAQMEEVRDQVEALENEREIAQKECDAAYSYLKECKNQGFKLQENIKHARETWKNRRDVVSQKEKAIREITGRVSANAGSGERSEGFGDRTPETVVLDTIRSFGEPVTVSRIAKRILDAGLYKGKSGSAYIATAKTFKNLLEKGQIHSAVSETDDKREKKFATA